MNITIKILRNQFYKFKKVQQGIIGLSEDKPNIPEEEMANLLSVTSRTIRNHIGNI